MCQLEKYTTIFLITDINASYCGSVLHRYPRNIITSVFLKRYFYVCRVGHIKLISAKYINEFRREVQEYIFQNIRSQHVVRTILKMFNNLLLFEMYDSSSITLIIIY